MISRALNLLELLSNSDSAFLFGARGVGKSRLSKAFLENRREHGHSIFEIDLLSLKQQARYFSNPEQFRLDIESRLSATTAHPLIVFIDEIQKNISLLDEVQYFIEQYGREKIKFLLTGSSSRKLKRGGGNLLGGRMLTLVLHPLSSLDLPLNLSKALQFGLLPRHYLESGPADLWLDSYIDSYLKEEVLSERLVRRLEPFHKFLTIAAQMDGRPLNYSEISRQLRLSDQTVRDYYQILIDTYLAFELPSWSLSKRKQIVLSPKIYLFDCGVSNAILGEQNIEVRPQTKRFGSLFENFVVTEFFKQNSYLRTRWNLSYWRTKTGQEVDLVLSRGAEIEISAIEIKSKPDPDLLDFKGLSAFKLEYPKAEAFCVCTSPEAYTIGGIQVLPWEEGITKILKKS